MRLLFLSGSIRNDSYNKKISRSAFDIARASGIDSTFLDLINPDSG